MRFIKKGIVFHVQNLKKHNKALQCEAGVTTVVLYFYLFIYLLKSEVICCQT